MSTIDSITYIVKTSTSMYHFSTDAYIGQRVEIVDAFSTYEEAMALLLTYCTEDYDEVGVWIEISVDSSDEDGNCYGRTLTPEQFMNFGKTQYFGPAGIFGDEEYAPF